MKKIVKSLAIVTAVAAIVTVGTVAFSSDREVSKDNTFTAGELDLKIDSDCHFNGMDCVNGFWKKDNEAATTIPCACKWDEKSLTSEKFFNFTNLKPGDSGETTISMHVIGDDAYARFKVANVKNNDRGCNRQEKKAETWMYGAGSETCDWNGGGELGANMDFAIWFDMGSVLGYQNDPAQDLEEGDNILNTPLEYDAMVEADGASATDWVELKYNGIYIPFRDCATYYIGVAWCVGDMDIDGNSYAMTCDGSTAGNIIQSDSYSSDSIFEVVQATHNDSTNPFSGM